MQTKEVMHLRSPLLQFAVVTGRPFCVLYRKKEMHSCLDFPRISEQRNNLVRGYDFEQLS